MLGAEVHVLATYLAVIGHDGFHDGPVVEAILDEPQRIDHDLVLALLATPGHHVVHPRGGAQDQPHAPVLDGAQIHISQPGVQLLVGTFHRVPEHLTQARGVRPHLGGAVAFRNPVRDFLQPLHDESPGEKDVDIVLEIDGDIRQAEERYGADLFDARQPGHAGLDRKRD